MMLMSSQVHKSVHCLCCCHVKGGGERAASTNGVPVKQLLLCTPEVAHAYSPSTAPRRTRTGASCIAELSR